MQLSKRNTQPLKCNSTNSDCFSCHDYMTNVKWDSIIVCSVHYWVLSTFHLLSWTYSSFSIHFYVATCLTGSVACAKNSWKFSWHLVKNIQWFSTYKYWNTILNPHILFESQLIYTSACDVINIKHTNLTYPRFANVQYLFSVTTVLSMQDHFIPESDIHCKPWHFNCDIFFHQCNPGLSLHLEFSVFKFHMNTSGGKRSQHSVYCMCNILSFCDIYSAFHDLWKATLFV